ncbi:hypothetical protein E2C01_010638 [Portunus trituberculatus]|uniref:Uncharacterized protein n=1 Tax=Portunus trituberculatus TaxID=210409 RepID=A0A5B7D973_PORTR|nr:hypothetical protein [Portunus trituberculatus]
MTAVTPRLVYISRQRSDIIDSQDRPKKFPSYILTRYPVNVVPNLARAILQCTQPVIHTDTWITR